MDQTEPVPCCPKLARTCQWLALLAAAVALLGSLDFSMRQNLVACPLCLYQRVFLMAVISTLGLCNLVPLLRETGIGTRLALPLAVAGLGVVVIHVRLEWNELLVCPKGFFALGTVPQQSLAAFALICGLLTVSLIGSAGIRWLVPGVILGSVFAYVCLASGPPPSTPPRPLAELRQEQDSLTLKTCTPVRRSETGS
jgi:disulfide bond formation protein DsbB